MRVASFVFLRGGERERIEEEARGSERGKRNVTLETIGTRGTTGTRETIETIGTRRTTGTRETIGSERKREEGRGTQR